MESPLQQIIKRFREKYPELFIKKENEESYDYLLIRCEKEVFAKVESEFTSLLEKIKREIEDHIIEKYNTPIRTTAISHYEMQMKAKIVRDFLTIINKYLSK